MEKRKIIKYSESFKLQVVHEYETNQVSISDLRKKYNIPGGATISDWIRKYGKPSIQTKIVRVETPDEKSRIKALEAENKKLKNALSHQTIAAITLESMMEVFAEEQGITVEELKKKLGKKL